ncbi:MULTISPECIES: hypothetical protein [unclassified Moorena]|uniref:hypothetical protein n=1 Tax=unclassified Moorena TaxID=2683338 RepID=UPI0025F3D801|nr:MULTISPECIES: hypothetical protein [unclassified Moorena]
MLRELYKKYYKTYAFWIKKSIFYDQVLSGTPDYIFSTKSELGKTVLEKPLVIIVEANKNDFQQGWGQCLAELVASKKILGALSVGELNSPRVAPQDVQRPVYGIVNDGNLWQFGRLQRDIFTQNIDNFTIDKLSGLYGALDYLILLTENYTSNQ